MPLTELLLIAMQRIEDSAVDADDPAAPSIAEVRPTVSIRGAFPRCATAVGRYNYSPGDALSHSLAS
jgi:hypothetical protein